MSSEGSGSPISAQEAADLLHKLSTESTKVQGILTSPMGRMRGSIPGLVRGAEDGTVWVISNPEIPGGPMLSFDPLVAVVCKYSDKRAMLNKGEGPFGDRFRSILSFVFRDGSTFSLFEFAEEDGESEE